MPTTPTDALVHASAKPLVSDLIREYERCTPLNENFNRSTSNDDVRFCRWSGQSADGKKWDRNMPDGRRAFPFEGASDARTYTVDDLINESVATEVVAFWRSLLRVQGVEVGDLDASAYAAKLFEWIMGTKQYRELVREVELHSQYTHTYGWSVLMVTWLQEHQLKLVPASMQSLMEIAAQAAQSGQAPIIAALPAMIMDETQESAVVKLLTDLQPQLTQKRARQAVRDLRASGTAQVPMPYLCRDEPSVRALKPWEEVFIPNDCTEIERARVVFVKEWLTEVELRQKVYTDGWDKQWADEAIKRKGEYTTFGSTAVDGRITRISNDNGFVLTRHPDADLIEVIHAFVRAVDEDNVPGIYVTTFHPTVGRGQRGDTAGLAARHELLDYAHGKMPFVIRKREHLARTITSSRGLPEVFYTTQRSIKVQEDAITDQTSLGVLPPLLVPDLMGVDYRLSPAGQIPVQGLGTGREPKFLQVPGANTRISFELIDRLERRMDRYVGRVRADEPAQNAQTKMQVQVQNNLLSWTEAFQQEFQLLQQFMSAEQFMRITGAPSGFANDPESIAKQWDFILTFDVRDLDPEYVQAKLKTIKDMVLPVDAAGRIDRAKLVELLLRAIDPTLAKELLLDTTAASKQVFNQVKADFLGILGGFEPEYVENDPTAGMQLQFGQQLFASNPKLQADMQANERTRELLQKWMTNRQQSVMQEQNKVIGRIGVEPEQMAGAMG